MPTLPDSNGNVDSILELERRILRTLCSRQIPARDREVAMTQLALHTWRAPENRVVYEALTRMRNRDAASVRNDLPSIATRMGFPDVDWSEYFEHDAMVNETELALLVGRLAAVSSGISHQP
ncbi:MAG: hypothetical protein ACRD5M_16495 [Candidatus Acidiferrales bacterium]